MFKKIIRSLFNFFLISLFVMVGCFDGDRYNRNDDFDRIIERILVSVFKDYCNDELSLRLKFLVGVSSDDLTYISREYGKGYVFDGNWSAKNLLNGGVVFCENNDKEELMLLYSFVTADKIALEVKDSIPSIFPSIDVLADKFNLHDTSGTIEDEALIFWYIAKTEHSSANPKFYINTRQQEQKPSKKYYANNDGLWVSLD